MYMQRKLETFFSENIVETTAHHSCTEREADQGR
jgi:hypothetical protein